MESFTLGIRLGSINQEILDAIRNEPLLIYYNSGISHIAAWNTLLETGSTIKQLTDWLISAPWSNLVDAINRIKNIIDPNIEKLNHGSLRIYIKYPFISQSQTITDKIAFGIRINKPTKEMIDTVKFPIRYYESGERYYIVWDIVTDVGCKKVNIDRWIELIDYDQVIAKINAFLNLGSKKTITIDDFRLQISYPFKMHYIDKVNVIETEKKVF